MSLRIKKERGTTNMIVLINILSIFTVLICIISILSTDYKKQRIVFFSILGITISVFVFLNNANFVGDNKRVIHEKIELKEILTTDKALTTDNEVVMYKEKDVKKIYKVQKDLENGTAKHYLVKYKTVSKKQYDNTFFNRKVSPDLKFYTDKQ